MDRLQFTINGVSYSVGPEVSSDVTLLDYIRNSLGLKGTKYMCRQAGCGACIVAAAKVPGEKPVSVNSCMVSITSCKDWAVTTIEQLGNRQKGYHVLQKTLAEYNGSQCGHCTPGWVMSMYCNLHQNRDLTMREVENSFAGNICRCTGYRPILEAFKSFAKDAPKKIEISDIEDLKICDKTGKACTKTCGDNSGDENDEGWCMVTKDDVEVQRVKSILLKDGRKWFKAGAVADVLAVLQREGVKSYMLVAGNTAKGVYPILEYPIILIDISSIQELKGYILDQNLVIGAGNTLTDLLIIYNNVSNTCCRSLNEQFPRVYPILEYPIILIDISSIQELKGYILDQNLVIGAGNTLTDLLIIYNNVSNTSGFEYLREFYNHLLLVAHIPVRNIGTIGGNLMIKYQHNEFQSDLYLMFETVGAELTIRNSQRRTQTVSMQQFLTYNMSGAVILNVKLPPLGESCRVITYKVMPRSQNAHAIVNFGALYSFNTTRDQLACCRLAFGGLSPRFTRAYSAETFLIGKPLFSNEVLQTAIRILNNELVVVEEPPEPSAAYRKRLAIGLFYKSLLTICPRAILNKRYLTGAIKLPEVRPVSRAQQDFETKSELWPLTMPIPKLEGLIQCAGEAFYTEDLPSFPNEVFAELILSTVGKGFIVSIDATKALQYPGVITYYTAKDIPGLNSFSPTYDPLYPINEEVFSSGEIKYFNQPIGVIVATTRHIAEVAATLVTVKYRNVTQPVTDIRIAKKDANRVKLFREINATESGSDIAMVVKGSNTAEGQYHFTMETIACVTRATEEGLEVYLTSQWLDAAQAMIAQALNMDANTIDIHVRRLGGGYGIKISRSILTGIACSLVSKKLNRPCRIIHSISTVTRAFGKRFPASNDYEFAINKNGVIQRAQHVLYEDNGFSVNELLITLAVDIYNNCYRKNSWHYKSYNATTDTAKNTWFRAPGSIEAIAFVEFIMEHISYAMSLDPIQVRLANLDPQHQELRTMLDDLLNRSNYSDRRIATNRYNIENRWKKRGFRFILMNWKHTDPRYFDVNLSVYHIDGTVSINHGGVEIGQGIHTKAVQICAYFLNIPLEQIQVKTNNTIFTPNSAVTGGSLTTQNIGIGVERCCKEILKRLEPIRLRMGNPSWKELIAEAFKSGIDLQAHAFVNENDVVDYSVYGVCLAEVEIDVLTGEMQVLRVDLTDDAGQSLNPELDIGQVEGAFIMGQGYWTTEKLVYSTTGELLTDRSWNYYVPQALDIPQDFRVFLRKNSYSSPTILGSKMIGEPPICMAASIPIAIREAVMSARCDSGIPSTTWIPFDGPSTTESICMSAATRLDEMKYY